MSKKTMPTVDFDTGWYNRVREPLWEDGMIDFYRHVNVKSYTDIDATIKFITDHDCPKDCFTIRYKRKGSNVRFFAVAPPVELK